MALQEANVADMLPDGGDLPVADISQMLPAEGELPSADVSQMLPEQTTQGEQPKAATPTGPIMSKWMRGYEYWGESLLGMRPGQMAASRQIAETPGQWAKAAFPGASGYRPTLKDLDLAASRIPQFAEKWGELKSFQREGADLAQALHGDNPDWNAIQGQYVKSVTDHLLTTGQLKPPEARRPPSALEMVASPDIWKMQKDGASLDKLKGASKKNPSKEVDLQENDFDRAVSEISKGARNGIPGVTRPPISDDELTAMGMAALESLNAGEIAQVGGKTSAALRGLAGVSKFALTAVPVGRGFRAMGSIGKALAPLAEGAALSTSDQLMQIASGNRAKFSPADVIEEAAIMGLGAKAGRALSVRFPQYASAAAALGQIGTMEVAHAAPEILKSVQNDTPILGDDPLNTLAEKLIETGVMVAGGGIVGMGESGKASEAATRAHMEQSAKKAAEVANAEKPSDIPVGTAIKFDSGDRVAYRGIDDLSEIPGKWSPTGRASYSSAADGLGEHGILLKFDPGETVEGSQYRPGGGGYIKSAGGGKPPSEAYVWPDFWSFKEGESKADFVRSISSELKTKFPGIKVTAIDLNDSATEARISSLNKDASVPGRTDYSSAKFTWQTLMQNVFRLRDETVKAKEIGKKTREFTLEQDIDLGKAERDLRSELDVASAGDQTKQAQIVDAVYNKIESDGRMPVPEGLAPKENIAKVEEAMRTVGKAGLEYGKLRMEMNRYPEARFKPTKPIEGIPDGVTFKVMKKEFDQGRTEEKTQVLPDGSTVKIPSMEVSREAAYKGDLGGHPVELVGGYKFHENRGVFFPRFTAYEEPPTSSQGNFGRRSETGSASPFANKMLERHMMARNQDFMQALAERPLDTSLTKTIDYFQQQSKQLRAMRRLDLGREQGMVLTEGELPQATNIAKLNSDMNELVNRNAAIKKELAAGGLDQVRQLQLRQERLSNLNDIGQIKDALKGKLYKKLGKEWGEWAGMYVHKDLFRQLNADYGKRSDLEHLVNSVQAMLKGLRVGTNLSQIIPDKIGNIIIALQGGAKLDTYFKHEARGARSEYNRATRDRTDLAFDALSEGANLGGSTDITERDIRELPFLEKRMREARENGEIDLALRLNWMIDSRHRAVDWLSKQPGPAGMFGKAMKAFTGTLGKISDTRRRFSDKSTARAIFRNAVEEGVGDSGPLSYVDAFDHTRDLLGYDKLPDAIQKAASYFSFIRFPAKAFQAAGTAMQRKPSIFGQEIDIGKLDRAINEQAGSNKAQAALVSRGLIRLALSTAQVAGPMLAMQTAMLSELGIDKKRLDKFIDDKFDYLTPESRSLIKLMYIPTGKTPLGGIEGINTATLFPQSQTLNYFWLNFSDPANPWWWQVLQRNVIAGPTSQAISRKNYWHQNVDEGFGPGDRWWPIINAISPAFPMQQLDAWAKEQNLPPEERDALRGVLRTVVGVPMDVMRNEGISKAWTDKMFADGVIGIEERDDGGRNYYVKNPKSLEGMQAQQILGALEKNTPDLFSWRMKQMRKIEKTKEAFQR